MPKFAPKIEITVFNSLNIKIFYQLEPVFTNLH